MTTRTWRVLKDVARSFYDDQMTHHAAALTYYALMSLFPAALLALSLLGLIGQYPQTYNAVVSYLRDVVPHATLSALDKSLRSALEQKGSAATALAVGAVAALYGTTGVLEAARRAMNVAFQIQHGRSFLRRKLRDILSSFMLLGLVLVTLIFVFVGGKLADHIFGRAVVDTWNVVRWPAAVVAAMVAFAYVYYVTPDLETRSFRRMMPGAVVAVIVWIVVSWGFSQYLTNYPKVSAIYGAFAGAIILIVWVWLSNVALLLGAEVNANLCRLGSVEQHPEPAA